jgi:hypothetical protein
MPPFLDVPSPLRIPMIAIRCLFVDSRSHCMAYSLEFGLIAKAETKAEAKKKLTKMIANYMEDALAGVYGGDADEMLARRAPPAIFVKYVRAKILSLFHHADGAGAYRIPIPVRLLNGAV